MAHEPMTLIACIATLWPYRSNDGHMSDSRTAAPFEGHTVRLEASSDPQAGGVRGLQERREVDARKMPGAVMIYG